MEKNIVGDLINFRGLVYSPVSEQGVVFLFGKVNEDLNMYIEEIRTAYPDCVARRFIGRGWERVYIEFEYKSSDFQTHKHDPQNCDIIVCWEHDWKDCPLEVIELRERIKEFPNRPVQPPVDTGVTLEGLLRERKLTQEHVDLLHKFEEEIRQTDDKVWQKVFRTCVNYYSPERLFLSMGFRKKGFSVTLFTRGKQIEGVKSSPSTPKWGNMGFRSENELQSVLEVAKLSLEQIREAVKNNEPTGWYAELEPEVETALGGVYGHGADQ